MKTLTGRRGMLLCGALSLLSLTACPGFGDEEPQGLFTEVPQEVNFQDHILPLHQRYCLDCHGSQARNGAPSNLRLDVCEDSGGKAGARTIAARSRIRVKNGGNPMPPTVASNPVSDLDTQIIDRWIECGSPCTPEEANTCAAQENNGDNNGQNNGDNNGDNNGQTPLTFTEDVLPVFNASCNFPGCHGTGSESASGIELTELDRLLARPDLLQPCDPDASALIQRLREDSRGFLPLMPQGGPELEEDVYQLLRTWVMEGGDVVPHCDQGDPCDACTPDQVCMEGVCLDPDPEPCEGVEICQSICQRDSDLECALQCTQRRPECRQCVTTGLQACAMESCQTQWDAFLICSQDCFAARNTLSCIAQLCQEEWDSLDACLAPALEQSPCQERFTECPL